MSSFGPKNPLLVILGPTSSGKSDLAVKIAKKFSGEIISADSRQVYRGMDIGTGKVPRDKIFNFQFSIFKQAPKSKLQIPKNYYLYKGVRHHLLNVANPKRRFTVAQYKKLTLAAIKKIRKAGKLPILCGGTGLYIQTVVDNLQIPAVKPNLKLRAELGKKSIGELFSVLKRLDPERAKNIDPKNPRRLIRAIEIVETTGKPVPALNSPQPPLMDSTSSPQVLRGGASPLSQSGAGGDLFKNVLLIGIKKSPAELKKLIHKRLLKRLKQGMVAEVKNLRQSGVSWQRLDDFGLEYRWLARFLQKKVNREEMISRLQKESEHYAKRQMTWFKRDQKIHWIKNKKQALKLVQKFLR